MLVSIYPPGSSKKPDFRKFLLSYPSVLYDTEYSFNEPSLEETKAALKDLFEKHKSANGEEKNKLGNLLQEILLNAALGCQVNIVNVIVDANVVDDYTDILKKTIDASDNNWSAYYRNEEYFQAASPFIPPPSKPRMRCEDGIKKLFDGAKNEEQVNIALDMIESIHSMIVRGEGPPQLGERGYGLPSKVESKKILDNPFSPKTRADFYGFYGVPTSENPRTANDVMAILASRIDNPDENFVDETGATPAR